MNRLQTKGLKVMGVISAHLSLRNHHAKAKEKFLLAVIALMNTSVRASRQRLAQLGCASVRPQSLGHSKASKRSQKGLHSPLTRTVLVRVESGIAPFPRLSGLNAQVGRTKTERAWVARGAGPEIQGHNICITIMPMQWTWN
jgi:hypothetical protein